MEKIPLLRTQPWLLMSLKVKARLLTRIYKTPHPPFPGHRCSCLSHHGPPRCLCRGHVGPSLGLTYMVHIPAAGPLHLPIPPPRLFFSQMSTGFQPAFPAFGALSQCHPSRELFPGLPKRNSRHSHIHMAFYPPPLACFLFLPNTYPWRLWFIC